MNEKPIPFFKRFVIQNFPFIEEDFDALTNYQLFCKVVEYLNKVIGSQNEVTQQMEYVLNYFNNLDVQDEIDNKLDEMAASGQLTDIIAQYLQLNGVLAFNTVSEMVNATNIVNGSICKTLGLSSYTDGGGRFYKIRTITNIDVVDGVNLIAISNNDQLVAELIPEDVIEDINSIRQELAKKPLVIIGDSHSTPINVPAANAWYTIVGRKLGLEVYNFAVGGSGYVREVTSGGVTGINFSKQVDNAISDSRFNNNDVKMVIVYGGVNDLSDEYASSLASNCASLVDKINTNFPNAIVCIVGINAGPNNFLLANNQSNLHYWQLMRQACVGKPAVFINSCLWNRKGSQGTNPYYNTENSHPNELGDKNVAANILNSLFGTPSIISSSDPNVCVYSATTGTGTLNISASSDQLIISGNATLDANGVAEFTDSNYIMNNKFSPQYLMATNTALTTAYITFNNTTHILKIKGSANQNYYFRSQVNLNI